MGVFDGSFDQLQDPGKTCSEACTAEEAEAVCSCCPSSPSLLEKTLLPPQRAGDCFGRRPDRVDRASESSHSENFCGRRLSLQSRPQENLSSRASRSNSTGARDRVTHRGHLLKLAGTKADMGTPWCSTGHRRPWLVVLAASSLLLHVLSPDMAECAEGGSKMGRRRPPSPPARGSTKDQGASPPRALEWGVWLVMKIVMHRQTKARNSANATVEIEAAKKSTDEGEWRVVRTTCHMNADWEPSFFRRRSPYKICTQRAAKLCAARKLGSIVRTTFQSAERDLPWVYRQLGREGIRNPRIYLYCLSPGNTPYIHVA